MKNLLFLSDTSLCSVHDKRLADAELRPLLADSWLRQDLSFLGFSPDGVGTLTPFKKPKGDVLLEPRMPSWELPVLSIFPSLSFPLATPY